MEAALTPKRSIKRPRQPLGRTVLEIVIIALLGLGALSILLPTLWAFSLSLGKSQEFFKLPPPLIPSAFRLDNYLEVFKRVPFGRFFLNSIFVTGVTTIGQLLTCSMGAYAFARLRFPLKNVLFVAFLAALMIPAQITIIPIFILMRSLGLVNQLGSLILPSLVSIFGVFLLRQFFETIPRDLEDAAKIDGAGYFRIYWQVILPLARPALAALGILTFNAQWNNFFGPLIFITSPEKMTLPLGLTFLAGQQGVVSSGIMMAGVILALIPVLVVFIVFQKKLIEGITFTGVTGG
jgi:multiple sugar transport system permease protein